MGLFSFLKKSKSVDFTALEEKDRRMGLEETFEKEHGKECYHYEDNIWKLIRNIDYDKTSPEALLSNYDEALHLAEELKRFCYSHGIGGEDFFSTSFSTIFDDIKRERAEYLTEEYKEHQEQYTEFQEKKAGIKKAKSYIVNGLKRSGGSALQKELKKECPSEIEKYFEKAVNSLCETGKLEKSKDKTFVRLELKK